MQWGPVLQEELGASTPAAVFGEQSLAQHLPL